MNWIESIREAIDYIEDNLDGDLKIDDIAKKVHISSFYFQKAFRLLCGYSVGEYIRNRRLANAGIDILTTDEKIIDIAMKYKYDSHDSFTKAFSRFHGNTPAAVRKGGQTIKSFAPLQVNILLKGGYIMDYKIEKTEGFSIILKLDPANNSITYIKDDNLPAYLRPCLGVYFYDKFPTCSIYCAEKDENEVFDGYEKYEISPITWAVFECAGTSRKEARENTWKQICNEWLPQTKYKMLSPNSLFILYDNYGMSAEKGVNPDEEDSDLGEIWVAIKEK